MRRERRTQLDVIRDMLELCVDKPLVKTAIMYRANLSFRQVEEYLSFCVKRGLLRNQIEGSRVVYTTTQKGKKLLDAIYHVESILKKGDSHA
jgi:predicted transcriptional regulator